jgi:polyribonucleotide nucleotidyltransferase
MDAGVPIKAPVAGISCGLIQDDDGSFTTFIDIQGVEDFHGDMDFKVAGTKKGITAIQMDLKNDGLTMEIIRNALDITYDARCQILDQIMLPCIAEPRAEVSQYAPKMFTMHIDPDKHPEVIGKGGKRHSEDRGRVPAARSTSTTTAPSTSPPRRPRAAPSAPRSASTTSSSCRRWASSTTAASCA